MTDFAGIPKRWLPLRFSLRTFFILFSAFVLWLGYWAQKTRSQRDAVQIIVMTGGAVTYDYECDQRSPNADWGIPSDGNHDPPAPHWLHKLIGVDALAD